MPAPKPPCQRTPNYQYPIRIANTYTHSTGDPNNPIPGVLLPMRGVIGPFEHLGFPSGFYEGQILRQFNDYDSFTDSTVAQEIARQLDAMHDMGINTVWFTLSATDLQLGSFVMPNCTVNPDLGPAYPQPTDTELTNLEALFDLIQSKNIQVVLNLSNINMEDQVGSATWLRAILNTIKDRLNLRPRKCLAFKTPFDVFFGLHSVAFTS